jgi:hypothetical protein
MEGTIGQTLMRVHRRNVSYMLVWRSTLVVICVVPLLFVLFCVLFVCKCVLAPGDNPIAVKYIIPYHIRSYRIGIYHIIHHIMSCHIISYIKNCLLEDRKENSTLRIRWILENHILKEGTYFEGEKWVKLAQVCVR